MELNLKGTTLSYFLHSLRIYRQKLADHAHGGNDAIQKELQVVDNVIRQISNDLKKRLRRGEELWMDSDIGFSAEAIALIKATMPLLIEHFENESREKIDAGAPVEATEGNNKKIAELQSVLEYRFMSESNPRKLIVGNPPKPEREQTSSTVINIQNHDGNVLVGNHNIIVQKQYAEASEQLSKLLATVEQSTELSDGQKADIRSDVVTIEAQLAKPKPNKSIIKNAFDALSVVVTVGTAMQFVAQVGTALHAVGLI